MIVHFLGNVELFMRDYIAPRGKISKVLGEIITESEIDLVVLGTHGRTGIR